MIDQDNKIAELSREKALFDSITGNKVYLRGVETTDLKKRVKWINDPSIQRTLNFQFPMSEIKAEKWLNTVASDMTRRDFSIVTREADEYIGFGGLLSIDVLVRKAELYVAIGDAKYRGKGGYGTDTCVLLTRYGFMELGLNRIYAYFLTFNYASRRMFEKAGWSVEGVLRQDLFAHGEMRDRTVVSILKSDWDEVQKK